MILPALRPLDFFKVVQKGETLICLRDQEGVMADDLVLSLPAFFIASRLDGRKTASQILVEVAHQFKGARITLDDIEKVVKMLDEQGALFSEHYEHLKQSIARDFHSSLSRPAYFAGKSYPDSSAELKQFLDDFFSAVPSESNPLSSNPLKAMLVPHIDFHRGGHAYARGYQILKSNPMPQTVLIFGVAHVHPPVPLILTRKSFFTPFGELTCDQQAIQTIADACDWDPFEHEIVHRTEHSIEFQTVMLSYLFGSRVKIIPVLCGAFPENPDHDQTLQRALNACANIAKREDHLIICGADLAHVGKRFGDEFEISDSIIESVKRRDLADLSHALRVRPIDFYQAVMADLNRRNVCGINSIYTLLKCLGHKDSGHLLHYDYAYDPSGGIVSFADMVWF